jgi:hypothetical protein
MIVYQTKLLKVISGGQCGVDRAGLDAARAAGLETGGTAPFGWRTWFGPAPELESYGLVQHPSPNYPPRTLCNVKDSDATLILASDVNSAGTVLTVRYCTIEHKPYLLVKLPTDEETFLDKARRFIQDNGVIVLNVAGNRDFDLSEEGQPNYRMALQLLTKLFTSLAD